MEFIPLEKYVNKKVKGKGTRNVTKLKPNEKEVCNMEVQSRKISKTETKKNQLKKVKNKYRERLQQVSEKKVRSKKVDKSEINDCRLEHENKKFKKISSPMGHVEEKNNTSPEKRCLRTPNHRIKGSVEKKENRLFVKLKKKILNEAQIKELHPDIRSVIFPRKKNSRWCWAVFVSEERANEALKELVKKNDILVTKPNPREMVDMKKEEKLKSIQRKKEARLKLKNMWM